MRQFARLRFHNCRHKSLTFGIYFIMVKIYYRKINYLILLDGVALSEEYFVLSDYQRHSLVAMPLHNADKLLPLCGSVQANALATLKLTDNYDSIYIKQGEYELLPLFVSIPNKHSPSVTMQTTIEDMLITCYCDGDYRLLVEDSENFIACDTPRPIETVEHIRATDGILLFARATDYIAIILRDSNDYYLIFQQDGATCELTDAGIRLTYLFNDTLRRQLTENYIYQNSEYILTDRHFNYRLNHKYIDDVLPILLIDAIMVRDYDFASTILAADLSQNFNALCDFFGKILCYYNLDINTLDKNCLSLLVDTDGCKTVKSFSFACLNGRISDITAL